MSSSMTENESIASVELLPSRGFDGEMMQDQQHIRQKNTKYQRNLLSPNGYFSRFFQIIRRINDLWTWKIPWIIIFISTVQVIVFFVAGNDIVPLLIFKRQKIFDNCRIFTYHTIHFSLSHLLLNIVLQFLIAFPLETEQGHCRVLIVYIVGIVFGAIGSMFFDSTDSLIGASSGVYSLLFSHISQSLLNWSIISYRNFRLISVSMLFFSDILYSIVFGSNSVPRTSFSAHLSSAISGFLSGLTVYKKFKNRSM